MQQFYLADDEEGVNSSMTFVVKNHSRRGEKAIENSTTRRAAGLPFSMRMGPVWAQTDFWESLW